MHVYRALTTSKASLIDTRLDAGTVGFIFADRMKVPWKFATNWRPGNMIRLHETRSKIDDRHHVWI